MTKRLVLIVVVILLLAGCIKTFLALNNHPMKNGTIIIKSPESMELVMAVARTAVNETGRDYLVERHNFGFGIGSYCKITSTEIRLIPEQQSKRCVVMPGGTGYGSKYFGE